MQRDGSEHPRSIIFSACHLMAMIQNTAHPKTARSRLSNPFIKAGVSGPRNNRPSLMFWRHAKGYAHKRMIYFYRQPMPMLILSEMKKRHRCAVTTFASFPNNYSQPKIGLRSGLEPAQISPNLNRAWRPQRLVLLKPRHSSPFRAPIMFAWLDACRLN